MTIPLGLSWGPASLGELLAGWLGVPGGDFKQWCKWARTSTTKHSCRMQEAEPHLMLQHPSNNCKHLWSDTLCSRHSMPRHASWV
jgi:hypothetical protein